MTLCVAGLNRRNVVVAGDRRLTTALGAVWAENRTKLTLVETRDARGVIAMAGLAEAGPFRTDVWIMNALAASATPEYTLGATFERLKRNATTTINGLGLSENERRLSLYFAGFGYPDGSQDDPRITYCILSNFERVGERLSHGSSEAFEITGRMEVAAEDRNGETPAAVLLGGNHAVVAKAAVEGFMKLLEADAPPDALLGKAVDLVRETARRPEAEESIGLELLTAIIPSSHDEPVQLGDVPRTTVASISAANYAHLGGDDDVLLIRDWTLVPGDPGARIVPKVGRNARCPCGSGRRYKRCHGA